MSYLKNRNNALTVEAILTKEGQKKLAQNGRLDIQKFSLADDEIDYTLYNNEHPQGSEYYDVAIVNLPLMQPIPLSGNTNVMKHKLFTRTDYSTTVYNMIVNTPVEFSNGELIVNHVYTITPGINPEYSGSLAYVATLIPPARLFGSQLILTANDAQISKNIADDRTIDSTLLSQAVLNTREVTARDIMGISKQPNVPSTVGNTTVTGQSFSIKLTNAPTHSLDYVLKIQSVGVSTPDVIVSISILGSN